MTISHIHSGYSCSEQPVQCRHQFKSTGAFWLRSNGPECSFAHMRVIRAYFQLYRVRFKEWPPLVLGLVTIFLTRLLQFSLMSCLLWIHLSKEVQYISIDQLELKLLVKMCFQSDPNFYVFEHNSRGWEFLGKVTKFFDLRGSQH